MSVLVVQGMRGFRGSLRLLDLRWTNIKGAGVRAIWRGLKENEHKNDEDIEIL